MRETILKEKNIGVFAIVITFLAIFREVIKCILYEIGISNNGLFSILKSFIFNFNFFEIGYVRNFGHFTFLKYNFASGISYFDLLFYSIMLIATIIYFTSSYKETRLLIFVFSYIFFNNFIGLAEYISYILQINNFKFIQILSFLIYFSLHLLVVLFTYWIMIKMLNKIELNCIQEGDNHFWVPASKFNRIVHLFLDLIFCFLFFWNIALYVIDFSIVKAILMRISEINERLPVYLLAIIFRFIYYFIFEGIFGTTPAKIITNSIVVNNDGKKASTLNIFKRTLIRFIPFESLSFITYGWHDTWSATNVFQLKPTKISGFKYFILFLTIAIGLYCGLYLFGTNY